MLNKKGLELSMGFIVIALLALTVLVVIILFFTGGMQKIFGQTAEVGEVTEQQISIWRGQCKLYCSTDQKEFCEHMFPAKKDKENKVKEIAACNADVFENAQLHIKYPDLVSGSPIDLGVVCEGIQTHADCPK